MRSSLPIRQVFVNRERVGQSGRLNEGKSGEKFVRHSLPEYKTGNKILNETIYVDVGGIAFNPGGSRRRA